MGKKKDKKDKKEKKDKKKKKEETPAEGTISLIIDLLNPLMIIFQLENYFVYSLLFAV